MIPHPDTTLIPNKRIRMDIYDIDGIIKHVMQSGIDISPADSKEWAMFCCSLRVLGYDESTFAALSWQDSRTQKLCRQVWSSHRNPSRYKSEDSARGMVVDLARKAGVVVKNFLLSRQDYKPERYHDRRRASATSRTAPTPPPEPTAPPVFIPMDAVRAAHAHAQETALFAYMAKEFGESAARFIFGVYMVGASKHTAPNGYRAAAFPYIDTAQRVVDCKLFHVDPTTGSRRTAPPLYIKRDGTPTPFSWVLTMQGKNENRAKWCNFGDHLLPERPTAEVCLVESEKTALVAALTYPDKIWIAVGSKYNLTAERCKPYIGRKVVIFPDRDGYDDKPRKDGNGIEKGWRTRAAELAAEGLRLQIDTTTERHYPKFLTDEDGNVLTDESGNPRECKADIADLILEYRHGTKAPPPPVQEPTDPNRAEAERIFERMKAENPALKEFAERFELTAVSVEPYNPEPHDTK